MKIPRIYISPTLNSNGMPRYNSQGPLYDAKYQGRVIVKGSREPGHDSARVLKALSVTGLLEVWDEVLPYCRFRLDIDEAAGLTIQEGEGRPLYRKFKSFAGRESVDGVLRKDGVAIAQAPKNPFMVGPPTSTDPILRVVTQHSNKSR